MTKSKFSMLIAAGALALSGGFAAPAAARTTTLGDERTRYSWKDKALGPRPLTSRSQRAEIAAWNAKVDAEKVEKRKARRLNKIREHANTRHAVLNGYRYPGE